MYVDIAVCLPLTRTFVYQVAEPVEIGCRVAVPFRRREVEGFVVGLRETAPEIEIHSVKEVIDRSPLLRPDVFDLCQWISEYYVSPLGEVLKAALPPGILPKHIERRLKNSPPKLGGVPFARFLANGGVVPQGEPPRLRLYKVASLPFLNGAATPPNLGGEEQVYR